MTEAGFVFAVFGGIGAPELLVVFAIVLLLFGGKKLPEVARSMGGAMRAFKEETNEFKRQIEIDEQKESTSSTDASTPASSDVEATAEAETDEDENKDNATADATAEDPRDETVASTPSLR